MARREDNRRGKREEEENEFTDRLVHINNDPRAFARRSHASP